MMDELGFEEEYSHPPGLVDVHCHILPQVDDGAPDMKTALAMLAREYDDGVRAVILTPHFRLRMFENEEEDIVEAYERLCEAAAGRFRDLELYLGCELHSHADIVDSVRGREQFRLAGSDYVLVEFSGADSQEYMRNRLYRLCANSFMPIVAHVERCKCVRDDLRFARRLVDMGVRFQVNADSVAGKDGLKVRRFCRTLMEEGLLYCIGSDAHDLKSRPPRMKECAAWISKKFGSSYMETLMINNPREIINAGVKYGDE